MSIDVGEISESDKQFGGKRKRTEVQTEAEDEGLKSRDLPYPVAGKNLVNNEASRRCNDFPQHR